MQSLLYASLLAFAVTGPFADSAKDSAYNSAGNPARDSVGDSAPNQDPCPHQITKTIPLDVYFSPGNEGCGGGFEFEWNGFKLRTPRGGACPLFAVITPKHQEWIFDKSSPTYVVPGTKVDIIKLDFECQISFPIFGYHYCAKTSEVVIGRATSYEVRPCAELEKAVRTE